jgi:glucose-6-phosphate 1-dehydrogenase
MENHADLLVIFGITGDLARRMTFRALYRLERRGLLDGPIIGVASDDIAAGELVKHAREAIGESGQDVDDAVFDRLARWMSYLHGVVLDGALYRRLATQVGRAKRPLYYLEVSPGPVRSHPWIASARPSSCARAGSPSRSRSATTWPRLAS